MPRCGTAQKCSGATGFPSVVFTTCCNERLVCGFPNTFPLDVWGQFCMLTEDTDVEATQLVNGRSSQTANGGTTRQEFEEFDSATVAADAPRPATGAPGAGSSEDLTESDHGGDEGEDGEDDSPGVDGDAANAPDEDDSSRVPIIAAGAAGGVAVDALTAMMSACCMLSRRREAAAARAAKAAGTAKVRSSTAGGRDVNEEAFPGATPPPDGGIGVGRERLSLASLVSPATEEFLQTSSPPEADYPAMYGSVVDREGGCGGCGGDDSVGTGSASGPFLESSLARDRRIYESFVDEV